MNASDRKKTIGFILVFSLLVIGIAFTSPALGGSPSSFGPGFILWGTAPLLVAGGLRLVTHDWSDAGLWPGLRKNARWYLYIILACPVIALFPLLMGTIFSVSTVDGFSMGSYLKMVLPGIAMFFIFAIFEEFGWRGYLAPKLASLEINPYLGYAITAVVWATWHLPYIRELTWVYASGDLISFIPRFYLIMFAYTILWNKIRLITGSVWPAVLIHCLTNAIQHPMAAVYLKIVPGMENLFSFNGLFMIGSIGILGIALNEWRSKFSLMVSLPK